METIYLHTCIERISSSLKLNDLIAWNKSHDSSWGEWTEIRTHTFSVRRWKLNHSVKLAIFG